MVFMIDGPLATDGVNKYERTLSSRTIAEADSTTLES